MPSIKTLESLEIFYQGWGDGRPVVFSHGWPGHRPVPGLRQGPPVSRQPPVSS